MTGLKRAQVNSSQEQFVNAQTINVINGVYDGQFGIIADCDPSHSCSNSVVVQIAGLGYVQLPRWYITSGAPKTAHSCLEQ